MNTAAAGNNAAAIQSLDDRVTAELASKLDSSALAPAIAPLATAAALATTDGQVAAHGSSIAALQSSPTTGLSNKADQSAFDVLEGVVATKSTPDGVDLKLSNYSTTAAMNGSIASANNATLATVAANYANALLRGRHRRGAGLRAREQRRLHLGAAGLQGGRQRADRVRPAVGRRHFLGGGLEDLDRSPGRSHHGGPGRRPRRQGGRQRAGLPALHGGRTSTGGRHQNSKCPAGSSITALQASKADAALLASYATNAALSASETALQSALDAILAELAALQLSGSGVVNAPARGRTSFATCTSWLLSLLRWPTATTR